MAQIDRHPIVPIGGRDRIEGVAVVVAGVVDEYVAAAELCDQIVEAGGIGAQVGDVARRETRRDGRIGAPRDESLARRGLDVAESDRGALPCEAPDDPLASPGAAAAADTALAPTAGVAGGSEARGGGT